MNRVWQQASCATVGAAVVWSLVAFPPARMDQVSVRAETHLVQLEALVSSTAITSGYGSGALNADSVFRMAPTMAYGADRTAAKTAAAFEDIDTSSPLYVAIWTVSILLAPLYYVAFPISMPVAFFISAWFNPDVVTTAVATALFPLNFPSYLVRVLNNISARSAQAITGDTARSSMSAAAEVAEPSTHAATLSENGGTETKEVQMKRQPKRVGAHATVARRSASRSVALHTKGVPGIGSMNVPSDEPAQSDERRSGRSMSR